MKTQVQQQYTLCLVLQHRIMCDLKALHPDKSAQSDVTRELKKKQIQNYMSLTCYTS